MSVFSWIGAIFEPATKLIDDLHFSGQEEAEAKAKLSELKNKLAEIEANVATKTLGLQSQIVEANAKVAIAEQMHGSMLSKNWRPLCSLGSFAMLTAMGFGIIPFNNFLAGIFGSFLGVYVSARSYEKAKR